MVSCVVVRAAAAGGQDRSVEEPVRPGHAIAAWLPFVVERSGAGITAPYSKSATRLAALVEVLNSGALPGTVVPAPSVPLVPANDRTRRQSFLDFRGERDPVFSMICLTVAAVVSCFPTRDSIS